MRELAALFKDKVLVGGLLISAAGLALPIAILLFVGLQPAALRQDSQLAAILPSPGTIVFPEVGVSERLNIRGLYSDGDIRALPDDQGLALKFSYTEAGVIDIDADGLVTAVGPGGADVIVEYGGVSAEVPIIVYGPFVHVPPIDETKVVLNDDGSGVALDRVIVAPVGGAYDPRLAEEIASEHDGVIVAEFKNLSMFILQLDINTPEELLEALEWLDADARVNYALPNLLFAVSNHPIESLNIADTPNERNAYVSTGLKGAWELMENMGALAKPVNIAVIDSGLYLQHTDPDIQQVLDDEFDRTNIHITPPMSGSEQQKITQSHHGIAVSSVIVATNNPPGTASNSNESFSGVVSSVPNSHYKLHFYVHGVGNRGSVGIDFGTVYSALDHIYDHSDKIDVVNMSWGEKTFPCIASIPILCEVSVFANKYKHTGLGNYTFRDNVVYVTSAGNDSGNAKGDFPANFSEQYDNVITVGALNSSVDNRWNDSNYGSAITVAVQGEHVKMVDIWQGYRNWKGTSLAAPLVSGVVALMRSADPDLTPVDIRNILVDTAKPIQVDTPDGPEQWRHVDAEAAIDRVLADKVKAAIDDSGFQPLQGVRGSYINFSYPITNTGGLTWKFYSDVKVKSPSGASVEIEPIETTLAPGQSISIYGSFWASEAGDWTVNARVRRDESASANLDELNATIRIVAPPAPGAPPAVAPVVPSTPGGVLQADANILLLADTSGSMEDYDKIISLKEALRKFVSRVDDPGESIGLIDFDMDVYEAIALGQFAGNQHLWDDAIENLDADGGTAFYDAVSQAVNILEANAIQGRTNIIIALTDGIDVDSSLSLNEVIADVQGSSVPVLLFALGFGDDAEMDLLEQLADATGGLALPANPDDVDRLYELLTTIF